jgi:hypothetical protein
MLSCTHRHVQIPVRGGGTYRLCSTQAVRSGPGTQAAARSRPAAEGRGACGGRGKGMCEMCGGEKGGDGEGVRRRVGRGRVRKGGKRK